MQQPWHRSMAGALVLVALAPATPAAAASQGALGATSRGSLTISISVRAPTRVSGLSDFAFDGPGTARNLCLSGSARTYTLAASGSGPGGTLSLSNGDRRIAYRIEWQPRAGANPVDAVSGPAPVTIRALADRGACVRAPGAGRLRIALDPAEAARLQADAPYTGALLLILAPD